MDLLTLEHFAGCLNETFMADIQGLEAPFVLVEAAPVQATLPGAQRTPFSLLFHNGSPLLFPQQTFRMRHPRLGDVGIFLVPIAQNREGFVYQAVFN
ncbi:DUF6916 family protein [Luteimonas deserti]|uniref:DUF6916 domain-containing protein n=1 Tax=Luteimonas deserti TaxID=2752306 RepID=A0A7Z0QMF5_9GAMM|nr:hypothetical protein [Luteimonas deserti]NYZ61331.1 hypothetical protein [Luteimonas deserti]